MTSNTRIHEKASYEFPSILEVPETLGEIYFRSSTLNDEGDKEKNLYFRDQSMLIDTNEAAIRQFYERNGTLKGLGIPGFNEANISSLEMIIRVLAFFQRDGTKIFKLENPSSINEALKPVIPA